MRIRFFVLFIMLISINNSYAQKSDYKLNLSLLEAAENGNTEQLIQILKKKPDIDFRDDNGGTALFYATQNHNLDIIKILVYNKAGIDLALYSGFTPLMSACVSGDLDIAELLVYSGANLDAMDEYWATALHYSVAEADFYITDMLLFYGANAKSLTYDKTSILLVAAMNMDTAIARLLISKGADINQINKSGYSPLSVAVQNNDTAFFDLLMAHDVNTKILEHKSFKPYAWALLNENKYAFEVLKPKSFGAEAIQNKRWNPLNIAYSNNDITLVRKLKKEGYESGIMPFYSSFLNQASVSFNNKDLFFNFGIGLQDTKYKTQLWLNYGTRFNRKAILLVDDNEGVTQLWEHRRYFELALQKYFLLPLNDIKLKPYIGVGVQWMMGYYDGMSQNIAPSFAFVPQLGFQVDLKPVFFSVSYEYTPYGLFDISPHKVKLGIGYQIHFINKQKPYELLW